MDFYAPAVWFQNHPERSLIIGGAFILLSAFANRGRGEKIKRPALIAGVAWLLYGINEFVANRQRADIRVDLVLFWPVLLIVTGASLAYGVWKTCEPKGACS